MKILNKLLKKQVHYDAFISYRHLPEDIKVAKRLQILLETQKVRRDGKRKKSPCRVFRDKSELFASSDLTKDIYTALDHSNYLIILCSPTIKESKWCMKEVNYFRSLHGNTNCNIFPVILEGKPEDVLPDVLKWELREMPDENGQMRMQQVEVEPFCVDIRAKRLSQKLRKLKKVEYMRIAAPIAGCRFDELYRRSFRRRFYIGSFVAGLVFLFCFLLSMLSQSRHTEAAVYSALAGQHANRGEWQSGLMYYNEAMSRDHSLTSERSAAVLLLQEQEWPCIVQIEEGNIYNGVIAPGFYEKEKVLNLEEVWLKCMDSTAGYYLTSLRGNEKQARYTVYDLDGNQTAILENIGNIMVDSYEKDYWAFYRADGMVTLYNPVKDARCAFYVENPASNTMYMPISVIPAGDRACLVLNREEDTLALYEIDFASGKGHFVSDTNLSEIFKERYAWEMETYGETLYEGAFYYFQTDAEQNIVIVGRTCSDEIDGRSDTAVLQLPDLVCKAVVSDDLYTLNQIAYCEKDSCFALSYGNGSDVPNVGGYAAVYDLSGKELFCTDVDEETAYHGAAFRNDGSCEVVFWNRRLLQFWNYRTGEEYAVSVDLGDREVITGVTCTEDAHCVVAVGNDLIYYNIAAFTSDGTNEPESMKYAALNKTATVNEDSLSLPLDDQFLLQMTESEAQEAEEETLTLQVALSDTDGRIYDKKEIAYTYNLNQLLLSDQKIMLSYSAPSSMLYVLFNNEKLYRIKILEEDEALADFEELATRDLLQRIDPVKDGMVAVSAFSRNIRYYKNDDIYWEYIGSPEISGAVKGVFNNWNDLFALVIEKNGHDILEFWDLKSKRRIIDFELKDQEFISEARFITERIFEYKTNADAVQLQVLVDAPDAKAADALRIISGMTMEDGTVKYVQEVFDGNLGSWGRYLKVHIR